MKVAEVVQALDLQVVAGDTGAADSPLGNEITGGYASDLLSCVMAGAATGNIWVTLQAHPNVIAVADLLALAAVVITEGTEPDAETLARAGEKGIPLLISQQDTFSVVSRLAALGIQGSKS